MKTRNASRNLVAVVFLIAPTILEIPGVKPPQPMDGRVLNEALPGPEAKPTPIRIHTLEAVNQLPNGLWRQYLLVSEFGGATYFDGANGVFAP